MEESCVVAEYQKPDCRGCGLHFPSPNWNLRRPMDSLGPPWLSLMFVQFIRVALSTFAFERDGCEYIHSDTSAPIFLLRARTDCRRLCLSGRVVKLIL